MFDASPAVSCNRRTVPSPSSARFHASNVTPGILYLLYAGSLTLAQQRNPAYPAHHRPVREGVSASNPSKRVSDGG